jgi:hypothetical protein
LKEKNVQYFVTWNQSYKKHIFLAEIHKQEIKPHSQTSSACYSRNALRLRVGGCPILEGLTAAPFSASTVELLNQNV